MERGNAREGGPIDTRSGHAHTPAAAISLRHRRPEVEYCELPATSARRCAKGDPQPSRSRGGKRYKHHFVAFRLLGFSKTLQLVSRFENDPVGQVVSIQLSMTNSLYNHHIFRPVQTGVSFVCRHGGLSCWPAIKT
eukprot:5259905-Pyramimonas_sp.AAC.1